MPHIYWTIRYILQKIYLHWITASNALHKPVSIACYSGQMTLFKIAASQELHWGPTFGLCSCFYYLTKKETSCFLFKVTEKNLQQQNEVHRDLIRL